LDLTSTNDKPSVAMFVSQIGGGIKSTMGLMEQTTALLRSKGVIIDAECDAMFLKLPVVPNDPSNVVEQVMKMNYGPGGQADVTKT
jgi:hypothetical protein